MPLPVFAARLACGEMADARLLASTRVAPTRLLATGYVFHDPELAGALQHLWGKQPAASEDEQVRTARY